MDRERLDGILLNPSVLSGKLLLAHGNHRQNGPNLNLDFNILCSCFCLTRTLNVFNTVFKGMLMVKPKSLVE